MLPAIGVFLSGAPAAAQTVAISGLSDITLSSLRTGQDVREAQNVCVYSDAPGGGYMVRASGGGSGGSFVLDAGEAVLPFSVEWSDRAGDIAGTALAPGLPSALQSSSATDPTCSTGAARSASLIIRVSQSDIEGARAGVNYSGTLSLTIAPQ